MSHLIHLNREDESEGKIDWKQMKVEERIKLIEFLTDLVKNGAHIREEEELKEVLIQLEEEGNKHVEEEIEGEGEEEKGEWDELTKKARNLVWVIESMKAHREEMKRREHLRRE